MRGCSARVDRGALPGQRVSVAPRIAWNTSFAVPSGWPR
jgi:hypothetical protein